jgi:hypothetical protein
MVRRRFSILVLLAIVAVTTLGPATPAEATEDWGRQCSPNSTARPRVCVWMRFDYANHRLRGYAEVVSDGRAAQISNIELWVSDPPNNTNHRRAATAQQAPIKGTGTFQASTELAGCGGGFRNWYATVLYLWYGMAHTQQLNSDVRWNYVC